MSYDEFRKYEKKLTACRASAEVTRFLSAAKCGDIDTIVSLLSGGCIPNINCRVDPHGGTGFIGGGSYTVHGEIKAFMQREGKITAAVDAAEDAQLNPSQLRRKYTQRPHVIDGFNECNQSERTPTQTQHPSLPPAGHPLHLPPLCYDDRFDLPAEANFTALMLASKYGHSRIVSYLLAHNNRVKREYDEKNNREWLKAKEGGEEGRGGGAPVASPASTSSTSKPITYVPMHPNIAASRLADVNATNYASFSSNASGGGGGSNDGDADEPFPLRVHSALSLAVDYRQRDVVRVFAEMCCGVVIDDDDSEDEYHRMCWENAYRDKNVATTTTATGTKSASTFVKGFSDYAADIKQLLLLNSNGGGDEPQHVGNATSTTSSIIDFTRFPFILPTANLLLGPEMKEKAGEGVRAEERSRQQSIIPKDAVYHRLALEALRQGQCGGNRRRQAVTDGDDDDENNRAETISAASVCSVHLPRGHLNLNHDAGDGPFTLAKSVPSSFDYNYAYQLPRLLRYPLHVAINGGVHHYYSEINGERSRSSGSGGGLWWRDEGRDGSIDDSATPQEIIVARLKEKRQKRIQMDWLAITYLLLKGIANGLQQQWWDQHSRGRPQGGKHWNNPQHQHCDFYVYRFPPVASKPSLLGTATVQYVNENAIAFAPPMMGGVGKSNIDPINQPLFSPTTLPSSSANYLSGGSGHHPCVSLTPLQLAVSVGNVGAVKMLVRTAIFNSPPPRPSSSSLKHNDRKSFVPRRSVNNPSRILLVCDIGGFAVDTRVMVSTTGAGGEGGDNRKKSFLGKLVEIKGRGSVLHGLLHYFASFSGGIPSTAIVSSPRQQDVDDAKAFFATFDKLLDEMTSLSDMMLVWDHQLCCESAEEQQREEMEGSEPEEGNTDDSDGDMLEAVPSPSPLPPLLVHGGSTNVYCNPPKLQLASPWEFDDYGNHNNPYEAGGRGGTAYEDSVFLAEMSEALCEHHRMPSLHYISHLLLNHNGVRSLASMLMPATTSDDDFEAGRVAAASDDVAAASSSLPPPPPVPLLDAVLCAMIRRIHLLRHCARTAVARSQNETKANNKDTAGKGREGSNTQSLAALHNHHPADKNGTLMNTLKHLLPHCIATEGWSGEEGERLFYPRDEIGTSSSFPPPPLLLLLNITDSAAMDQTPIESLFSSFVDSRHTCGEATDAKMTRERRREVWERARLAKGRRNPQQLELGTRPPPAPTCYERYHKGYHDRRRMHRQLVTTYLRRYGDDLNLERRGEWRKWCCCDEERVRCRRSDAGGGINLHSEKTIDGDGDDMGKCQMKPYSRKFLILPMTEFLLGAGQNLQELTSGGYCRERQRIETSVATPRCFTAVEKLMLGCCELNQSIVIADESNGRQGGEAGEGSSWHRLATNKSSSASSSSASASTAGMWVFPRLWFNEEHFEYVSVLKHVLRLETEEELEGGAMASRWQRMAAMERQALGGGQKAEEGVVGIPRQGGEISLQPFSSVVDANQNMNGCTPLHSLVHFTTAGRTQYAFRMPSDPPLLRDEMTRGAIKKGKEGDNGVADGCDEDPLMGNALLAALHRGMVVASMHTYLDALGEAHIPSNRRDRRRGRRHKERAQMVWRMGQRPDSPLPCCPVSSRLHASSDSVAIDCVAFGIGATTVETKGSVTFNSVANIKNRYFSPYAPPPPQLLINRSSHSPCGALPSLCEYFYDDNTLDVHIFKILLSATGAASPERECVKEADERSRLRSSDVYRESVLTVKNNNLALHSSEANGRQSFDFDQNNNATNATTSFTTLTSPLAAAKKANAMAFYEYWDGQRDSRKRRLAQLPAQQQPQAPADEDLEEEEEDIDIADPGQHVFHLSPILSTLAHQELIALADTLLSHGASISAISDQRDTALHLAARAPSSDTALVMMQMLLDSGADIDAVDDDGRTALDVAMRENGPNAVSEGFDSGRELMALLLKREGCVRMCESDF